MSNKVLLTKAEEYRLAEYLEGVFEENMKEWYIANGRLVDQIQIASKLHMSLIRQLYNAGESYVFSNDFGRVEVRGER